MIRNHKIAVILITLNEAHNIKQVYDNLNGWADEIFIVDSYSKDNTVDIALSYGINVVQRKFRGFGNQWNFALNELPISSSWVMKLDPDERISDELKGNIIKTIESESFDAISFNRRLWFMQKPLPIYQKIIRVWKSGHCHFSDVSVNEYPIINGNVGFIYGDLEHYDSPDLDHWLEKQNRYTTSEAIIFYQRTPLSDKPYLFGTTSYKYDQSVSPKKYLITKKRKFLNQKNGSKYSIIIVILYNVRKMSISVSFRYIPKFFCLFNRDNLPKFRLKPI